MPKMRDVMKKSADTYVTSRKKREHELAAASPDNPSDPIKNVNNLPIDQITCDPVSNNSPTAPAQTQKSANGAGRPRLGRTSQLTLMMDPKLKRALKKYAVDKERSVAAIIEDLVRELLDADADNKA